MTTLLYYSQCSECLKQKSVDSLVTVQIVAILQSLHKHEH